MTFRGRTMQALHVVMLFIVELLLTFPLSSEYKKIFFLAGSYDMWLAGSQFPDQGMNPHPWRWEHRVLTTEPPENSLGRSLERDIERSTFFLSHHASMWFCSALSKPPFLDSSQQSNPFIFIYWMAKHNEHNFKLFLKIWKFWIQQNLSILAKGELPGKEKEVFGTNVNRLLF